MNKVAGGPLNTRSDGAGCSYPSHTFRRVAPMTGGMGCVVVIARIKQAVALRKRKAVRIIVGLIVARLIWWSAK